MSWGAMQLEDEYTVERELNGCETTFGLSNKVTNHSGYKQGRVVNLIHDMKLEVELPNNGSDAYIHDWPLFFCNAAVMDSDVMILRSWVPQAQMIDRSSKDPVYEKNGESKAVIDFLFFKNAFKQPLLKRSENNIKVQAVLPDINKLFTGIVAGVSNAKAKLTLKVLYSIVDLDASPATAYATQIDSPHFFKTSFSTANPMSADVDNIVIERPELIGVGYDTMNGLFDLNSLYIANVFVFDINGNVHLLNRVASNIFKFPESKNYPDEYQCAAKHFYKKIQIHFSSCPSGGKSPYVVVIGSGKVQLAKETPKVVNKDIEVEAALNRMKQYGFDAKTAAEIARDVAKIDNHGKKAPEAAKQAPTTKSNSNSAITDMFGATLGDIITADYFQAQKPDEFRKRVQDKIIEGHGSADIRIYGDEMAYAEAIVPVLKQRGFDVKITTHGTMSILVVTIPAV